ncbi:DUF4365 domain-containing protein [Flavobacterium hungaricum]|uniref:DUF4365 domain-containing protein n=1 Tax=Flavobacterium hungaricum TaxID=2082725 RepID=A0ABR9TLJ6_9FLAO|nr:DUF4365 domain-containing protein [Flavobacterium hungaricum]MBE8726242.1 DUF4365 domain-containing protein [Flavobacterium hungaricum]
MSQRTRNHIIEEESRMFFKKSIPQMWVYRDKHDDYGIDCEIEIFDEQGNPTGTVFWVQLKGTDSKDQNLIKSINFSSEKMTQFLAYDIPVLIVRYSSYNQNLFFRWAKNVRDMQPSKKSVNFKFSDTDVWTSNSHIEIIKYLKNQILIKQGRLQFPITVSISKELNNPKFIAPHSYLTIIKSCLANHKKYFSLVQRSEDSFLQIYVDSQGLVSSLCDLSLARMKITFQDVNNINSDLLVKHILVTITQCLFDVGKGDLGNQLIFKNNLLSFLKNNEDYLSSILSHLLEGEYFSTTVNELSQYFKENKHDNILETMMSILLLSKRKSFDDEKLLIIENFLEEQLAIAKLRENNLSIAGTLYNLGNFYRSVGEIDKALTHYIEVRKYNASYKKHSYYLFEIGGLLFLKGKPSYASRFYQKAIELKTNHPLAKALLADALLYSGKYLQALEKYDEFLNEISVDCPNPDEWFLKYSCLKTILQNGYPETQTRDSMKANDFVEKGECEKALEFDLLDSLAWYNLAVTEIKQSNNITAFLFFSISALLDNRDCEAWTNATFSGFIEEIDFSLLVNVIRTAYFYNGQEYINYVYESMQKKNLKPEVLNTIIELIDNTVEERIEEPFLLRNFFNENEFIEITMNSNG